MGVFVHTGMVTVQLYIAIGLLFSWLHMLQCTVVITSASFLSSCLVHMMYDYMQFFYLFTDSFLLATY